MAVLRWISALAVLLAGCGDGDDVFEATPILELPPRISRACSVVSPTTEIADGQVNGFGLVTMRGRHHAVTTRNDQTITVSALQLEPITLGAPVWSATTRTMWSPAAAPREDGRVGLVGFDSALVDNATSYQMAIAVLDENGAQVGTTQRVPNQEGMLYDLSLAARPGGFALAWSDGVMLRVLLLGDDGAPAAEPVVMATGRIGSAQLVRHGDGFALGWSERDGDTERLHAVLLDASGHPRTEAHELPTRRDRKHYGLFLASVGSDVLLTWEESYRPEELGTPGGYTIVRVARMTADGAIAEPLLRLQAPEADVVNVNPTILAVDGAVALSWSRGHYIPVCGGCITDNQMNLVELDPVDLAPVSNVIEFGGPSGLRSAPIASLDGIDIAYLLAIDRHARFDFAAAMVRCTME
jgi:hypothetical protein